MTPTEVNTTSTSTTDAGPSASGNETEFVFPFGANITNPAFNMTTPTSVYPDTVPVATVDPVVALAIVLVVVLCLLVGISVFFGHRYWVQRRLAAAHAAVLQQAAAGVRSARGSGAHGYNLRPNPPSLGYVSFEQAQAFVAKTEAEEKERERIATLSLGQWAREKIGKFGEFLAPDVSAGEKVIEMGPTSSSIFGPGPSHEIDFAEKIK